MNENEFKLTSKQEEALDLFISKAKHIMLYGGSRCVSGDTILNGHTKTIKELAAENKPIEVLTTYGKRIANPPFKKGECQLLKIVTESNKRIEVTLDHKFWNGSNWVEAKNVKPSSFVAVLENIFFDTPLQSSLEFSLSKFLEDVPSLKQILLNSEDHCFVYPRQYGPPLRFFLISFLASYAFQSYAQEHNRRSSHDYLFLLNNQKDLPSLLEVICNHSDQKLFHLSMQDGFPFSFQNSLFSDSFFSQIFELFQGLLDKDLTNLLQLSLPESFELAFRNYFDQFYQLSTPNILYSLDTPKKSSYKLERVKESTATTIKEYYTLNVPILEHYYANDFLNHNSGKTLFTVWALIMRACKTRSRHVILRDKFNHAKRSLWLDTIPKVLNLAFPTLNPKINNSDYYMKLINGSEIWIGGLDSKDRTEKILGTEYSTIYFNETSQIDYSSISLANTRLAEKSSLVKKVYYDSNPPKKSAWQYWVFEKKLNPIDNEPLKNPDDYASLLMNPIDNIENIDDEYIKMLESLPKNERERFLLGLYQDESDGSAYYEFKRDLHVFTNIKQVYGSVFIACDFNVNPMCSIAFQFIDGKIKVFKEFFLTNSDTYQATRAWLDEGLKGAQVIPDSTGKNRKTSGVTDFEIIKESGFQIMSTYNPFQTDRVNNLNWNLRNNKIEISDGCRKLINDLEKVVWKDNKLDQRSDPMLTHLSDCLGYASWKLLQKESLKPIRAYQ